MAKAMKYFAQFTQTCAKEKVSKSSNCPTQKGRIGTAHQRLRQNAQGHCDATPKRAGQAARFPFLVCNAHTPGEGIVGAGEDVVGGCCDAGPSEGGVGVGVPTAAAPGVEAASTEPGAAREQDIPSVRGKTYWSQYSAQTVRSRLDVGPCHLANTQVQMSKSDAIHEHFLRAAKNILATQRESRSCKPVLQPAPGKARSRANSVWIESPDSSVVKKQNIARKNRGSIGKPCIENT